VDEGGDRREPHRDAGGPPESGLRLLHEGGIRGAGGVWAVGLDVWTWVIEVDGGVFNQDHANGLWLAMTAASSAAVGFRPDGKGVDVEVFLHSETKLLRTSTKLGEMGMAMRRVGRGSRYN